jgi:hypothetical protein
MARVAAPARFFQVGGSVKGLSRRCLRSPRYRHSARARFNPERWRRIRQIGSGLRSIRPSARAGGAHCPDFCSKSTAHHPAVDHRAPHRSKPAVRIVAHARRDRKISRGARDARSFAAHAAISIHWFTRWGTNARHAIPDSHNGSRDRSGDGRRRARSPDR